MASGAIEKTTRLDTYLNDIVVAMLTGAAIVRRNRIAAEAAKRAREEAHEAYLREQERLRYEARVDAFIESKADELVRLQKIVAFRNYLSSQQMAPTSREEAAILGAVDDLLKRLRRSLSVGALRRAVNVSE